VSSPTTVLEAAPAGIVTARPSDGVVEFSLRVQVIPKSEGWALLVYRYRFFRVPLAGIVVTLAVSVELPVVVPANG
jgi:hypothetical protein